MNKVFVIIVTYNGLKWIDKCLLSCASYNVVVVDNQSTDNTVKHIKSNFPNVKVLVQPKNLGFGKANNIGLKYALSQKADFFLLLNQDAYLEENTIQVLQKQLINNPTYGVVSPLHLAGNNKYLDLQFQSYLVPSNCRTLHNDIFLKKELNPIYEAKFVNAAIWLISKQTLKIVGGFNPYFFHYAEDNDYLNRCKYKNIKLGVVPNISAIHDREQRFREQSDYITIKNYLSIKLMNPNENKSIYFIIKLAFKQAIKNFTVLNFIKSYLYIKNIIYILRKKKEIAGIKEELASNNYPFLDYNI